MLSSCFHLVNSIGSEFGTSVTSPCGNAGIRLDCPRSLTRHGTIKALQRFHRRPDGPGPLVRLTHRHEAAVRNSSPFWTNLPFHYFYPSQTKMLEGGTKDEIRIFLALFKGVSTLFRLLIVEKSVENLDFIFCSSFHLSKMGMSCRRLA